MKLFVNRPGRWLFLAITWALATVTSAAISAWSLTFLVGARDEWSGWANRCAEALLPFASYTGTVTICLGLAGGLVSRDTIPPAIADPPVDPAIGTGAGAP